MMKILINSNIFLFMLPPPFYSFYTVLLIIQRNWRLLYIQCRPDDKYVNSKLEYFKSHSDAKFICINSLDKSTEYSKEQIVAWLENLMELK